jgi:hypothetical protein
MKDKNKHRQLTCSACHDAHEYNTKIAAVESCMKCHDDKHTTAFKNSAHYRLWQQAQRGEITAEKAVSCATCHLPRIRQKHNGVERVVVQHNQNLNLRPNEKMIRQVCMNCHGLAFSIDALADEKLVENNFSGAPGQHIASIEMAKRREIEKAKKKGGKRMK